eukprot:4631075-Amphidinium_carterae.1
MSETVSQCHSVATLEQQWQSQLNQSSCPQQHLIADHSRWHPLGCDSMPPVVEQPRSTCTAGKAPASMKVKHLAAN